MYVPCFTSILVIMTFSFCRKFDDDISACEMVCTLNIDADLLRAPLAYKYVIYSPKVTKCNECYEKLHPLITSYMFHDDPNRCLWLTPQEMNSVRGGIV